MKTHFVSTKQGHFLCKNNIYHIYQNAQEGQTPKITTTTTLFKKKKKFPLKSELGGN